MKSLSFKTFNVYFPFLLFVLFFFAPHVFAATTNETLSSTQLKEKYIASQAGGPRVHILIVPGHEPEQGGAEYLTLKERDIVVPLAAALANSLAQDPHLKVTLARSLTAWNPELSDYFTRNWDAIRVFITNQKAQMSMLLANGEVTARTFEVDHTTASPDVATRLYGINRWADENNVDIAINIHLNDNTDHGPSTPGANVGFAIYVPDAQYANASSSKDLGNALASQLNTMSATSSLPIENYGVLEDQALIALGSNNSAHHASVLIEYAYIYEPQLAQDMLRATVTSDFAHQTYRGLESYLGTSPKSPYTTLTLPHTWYVSPTPRTTSVDTYALQAALHTLNLYPASGRSLYDCPISGYMGPCTVNAIKAFQRSKGIQATGTLGPRTRAVLNRLFGT